MLKALSWNMDRSGNQRGADRYASALVRLYIPDVHNNFIGLVFSTIWGAQSHGRRQAEANCSATSCRMLNGSSSVFNVYNIFLFDRLTDFNHWLIARGSSGAEAFPGHRHGSSSQGGLTWDLVCCLVSMICVLISCLPRHAWSMPLRRHAMQALYAKIW